MGRAFNFFEQNLLWEERKVKRERRRETDLKRSFSALRIM